MNQVSADLLAHAALVQIGVAWSVRGNCQSGRRRSEPMRHTPHFANANLTAECRRALSGQAVGTVTERYSCSSGPGARPERDHRLRFSS